MKFEILLNHNHRIKWQDFYDIYFHHKIRYKAQNKDTMSADGAEWICCINLNWIVLTRLVLIIPKIKYSRITWIQQKVTYTSSMMYINLTHILIINLFFFLFLNSWMDLSIVRNSVFNLKCRLAKNYIKTLLSIYLCSNLPAYFNHLLLRKYHLSKSDENLSKWRLKWNSESLCCRE